MWCPGFTRLTVLYFASSLLQYYYSKRLGDLLIYSTTFTCNTPHWIVVSQQCKYGTIIYLSPVFAHVSLTPFLRLLQCEFRSLSLLSNNFTWRMRLPIQTTSTVYYCPSMHHMFINVLYSYDRQRYDINS